MKKIFNCFIILALLFSVALAVANPIKTKPLGDIYPRPGDPLPPIGPIEIED